jgi:hypothetical protein
MNKEAIKKRIRALREMTTARGCTEAEAMAAAAKLANLMAEHQLDDQEIEIDSDAVKSKTSGSSPRAKICGVISWATNTACIFTFDDEGKRLAKFYGSAPGPEIATYLVTLCNRAIDQELRTFKKERFYRNRKTIKTRREAANGFTVAMVNRLSTKIYELFVATHDETAALVAQNVRDKEHSETVSRSPIMRTGRYWEAAAAGHRAGDKVAINHGVSGTEKQLQIGARE